MTHKKVVRLPASPQQAASSAAGISRICIIDCAPLCQNKSIAACLALMPLKQQCRYLLLNLSSYQVQHASLALSCAIWSDLVNADSIQISSTSNFGMNINN